MTEILVAPSKTLAGDSAGHTMDDFFAFYDSGTDSALTAQTYADEASMHAKQSGKDLPSEIVDISVDSPANQYWCGKATIECVTVKDGKKCGSLLNPADLSDVDALVDALFAS